MSLARRLVWLLPLLVLAYPTRAAAEASAEERAVAADLFRQATAARENKDWATCERHLTEAVEIVETPGLRFHLAHCKEQQQHWVAALVDYRRAGELMKAGAEANDVATLLPDAIEQLEGKLPRLTLLLDEVPQGTELYLDGQTRSTKLFGKAIPLDPGNRRVDVVASGFEAFSQQVTLLPGEQRELNVVLVEEQPEASSVTAAPRRSEAKGEKRNGTNRLTPKSYVMIAEAAVAAVGLGFGVAFTIRAADLEDQRANVAMEIGDSSACAGNTPDDRCGRLRSLAADASAARTVATASYITGAASVGALLGTWLLWREDGNNVRVSVSPSQRGWQTMLSATF